MKVTVVGEASFEGVLDALIAEAKRDRERVNSTNVFDVDTKRAVATVVTKLEEARMGRWQAHAFYDMGEE